MALDLSGENLSYMLEWKSRKLGNGKGPISTIIGRKTSGEGGGKMCIVHFTVICEVGPLADY